MSAQISASADTLDSAVVSLAQLHKIGDLCLSCASKAVAQLALALMQLHYEIELAAGAGDVQVGMHIARIVSESACCKHTKRYPGSNRTSCTLSIKSLSVREHDVLGLIAHGKSNKQIARMLQISDATVKTHIRNIFSKLGVEKRAQAVACAWFELRL